MTDEQDPSPNVIEVSSLLNQMLETLEAQAVMLWKLDWLTLRPVAAATATTVKFQASFPPAPTVPLSQVHSSLVHAVIHKSPIGCTSTDSLDPMSGWLDAFKIRQFLVCPIIHICRIRGVLLVGWHADATIPPEANLETERQAKLLAKVSREFRT